MRHIQSSAQESLIAHLLIPGGAASRQILNTQPSYLSKSTSLQLVIYAGATARGDLRIASCVQSSGHATDFYPLASDVCVGRNPAHANPDIAIIVSPAITNMVAILRMAGHPSMAIPTTMKETR